VTGRGRIYVSFQLSDTKEMKKNLGKYTDNPDQYIQVFITIIQTYDLDWKDVMLLLDQTLTSLEKPWVLAQATQMGDYFHLQWAPVPSAPGNEGIQMPQCQHGTGTSLSRPLLGPK
jgi:hypothetical protein